MSRRKSVSRRQWLNSLNNHNLGHLYWGYSVPGDRDPAYETSEFSFVLFDCSRSTSLDIGCYTEAERKNSIRKLSIIRDACNELISALKVAELDKDRRKRLDKPKGKKVHE